MTEPLKLHWQNGLASRLQPVTLSSGSSALIAIFLAHLFNTISSLAEQQKYQATIALLCSFRNDVNAASSMFWQLGEMA